MKHCAHHDVVTGPTKESFLLPLFSLTKDLNGGIGRKFTRPGKREHFRYISMWFDGLFMPFEPQNFMPNAGFTLNGINFTDFLLPERRLRVFQNRALRIIFGPKRDEETREWSKLHNEELNDLYSSPNIVRVIKSRIMR